MNPLLEKISRAAAWSIGRLLPVQKNKIVVSSYYGRGYSDNPKAIVEELLRRQLPCRIVWLTDNSRDAAGIPPQVEIRPYSSVQRIFQLSTAQVWIDNCRKGARYKKKSQIYMQTWHGFALKRIEKDVLDTFPPEYESYARRDSAFIDLIVSDSAFMSEIYRRSFWYDGAVCEFGSPRNDIMHDDPLPYRQKVMQQLGLPADCKMILYAPTFRADHSLDAYCLDYRRLRRACEQRFGGNWVVLIRLHPNIMQKAGELDFDRQTCFDATAYEDMQELLAAADAVVSDYSSLMFDFALTGRPCFRFAVDIESYKNDRNFYLPLDQLPFSLATDNDEMEAALLGFDEQRYAADLHSFMQQYGIICDGRAASRCADWLCEKLNLNDKSAARTPRNS